MEDRSSNSVKFLNLNHTVTRPTEGQLKWARLHQKRVAVQVQRYVERLYQRPASIHNAPAYHGEVQPYQSLDTNHSTIPISEGRRALLNVSNFEYDRRKQYIAVNGYRFHRSTSDDESDQSTNHDEVFRVHFQPNQQILPNCNNMPMSGNIPSTGRRKFRRRRKKFQPRCSDPERVRRFKEAFQVALHSLELASVVSQQPQHTNPSSTVELDEVDASSPNMERKKWKRPQVNEDECTYLADTFTVYGCSAVPKRPPSVHNPTWTPGKAPLDRGATWLNLLPTSHTKTTDRRTVPPTPVPTARNDEDGNHSTNGPPSHRSVLTPALRQHVADVAREIFSGDRKTSPHRSPLVGNDGDTLEREIHSFVDQFEEHWLQLESDSVDGHDDEDDEDSVVPVWSPPPANDITRPRGHHPIIPMVTYDSDDENSSQPHHESVWKQKSLNLDETFTQELDCSVPGWNRSTTTNTGTVSSPMIMTMEDGGNGDVQSTEVTLTQRTELVTKNSAVDDETHDVAINVESSIRQHDTIAPLPKKLWEEHEMLEFSPMNLKEYIRRLPDPDEINAIFHTMSLRTGPLSVFDQQRVSYGNHPRVMERPVTSRPPVAMTAVVPPPPTRPDRNAPRDDHPTTSAGCGLYTERGGPFFQSHHEHHAYDVAWERSWRL